MSQWEHFKLGAAIRTWFLWSREKVLRRNYARLAFSKYSQVCRSNHFTAWRLLCISTKMNRSVRQRRYVRAWARKAHDTANLKRAVKHAFGSTLQRFFESWRFSFLHARHDARRKLFRLCILCARVKKTSGLAIWRSRVDEHHSLEASLKLWRETGVLLEHFFTVLQLDTHYHKFLHSFSQSSLVLFASGTSMPVGTVHMPQFSCDRTSDRGAQLSAVHSRRGHCTQHVLPRYGRSCSASCAR